MNRVNRVIPLTLSGFGLEVQGHAAGHTGRNQSVPVHLDVRRKKETETETAHSDLLEPDSRVVQVNLYLDDRGIKANQRLCGTGHAAVRGVP